MPRGKRLSAMAWTRLGARKASESSIAVDRTERFSRCAEIRDVENPPSDKVVEPAARPGDACKQLSLDVRPRRSRVGMNALDRRDEFVHTVISAEFEASRRRERPDP
jgi:hypothetical protein